MFVVVGAYLMEQVVPEQFKHVSVASLGPSRVHVELCPVHHRAQLREEADYAAAFDIPEIISDDTLLISILLLPCNRLRNSLIHMTSSKKALIKGRLIWLNPVLMSLMTPCRN